MVRYEMTIKFYRHCGWGGFSDSDGSVPRITNGKELKVLAIRVIQQFDVVYPQNLSLNA